MITGLLLLGAAWLGQTPAPGDAAADAAAAVAADAAVHLEVTLDPPEVTVGDRVTALLTVTVAADRLAGEPRFPAWGERWGEAEIFAAPDPERLAGSNGVAAYRQRLEIAAFRPGRVALPPVTVAVPLTDAAAGDSGEATTPADLALTVTSVLPPPPQGEDREGATAAPPPPRPEAPPLPLPLGRRFWWTAAVGGLACLLLGLLVWRRSPLARAAASSPPAMAPLAELEAALGRLGALDSPLEGHVVISLALRRYLGRELGFPAAESSTTEIRRALAGRALPPALRERTTTLLAACDLVKFARGPAQTAEVVQRGGAAREIARTLDLHLHPPRPEADRSPGGPLR